MDQKQLSDYYLNLTNMTSQVDSYTYAISENIAGSSPYWNVESDAIDELKDRLAKVEHYMKAVIYWAEKARDLNYEPSESEKLMVFNTTDNAKLSLFAFKDVLTEKILIKAPFEWVEKVKIFMKQLQFYLDEILRMFKPQSDIH